MIVDQLQEGRREFGAVTQAASAWEGRAVSSGAVAEDWGGAFHGSSGNSPHLRHRSPS